MRTIRSLILTWRIILAQDGQPHPCAKPLRNQRAQKMERDELDEKKRVAKPLMRSPVANRMRGLVRSDSTPAKNLLTAKAAFWQERIRPEKQKKH
ncbi:hypothetical protein TNCV_4631781 [Trichonephila clavipes]|nr:hypothetical protein TNCV_4631781 [Trichonephila clavipes]